MFPPIHSFVQAFYIWSLCCLFIRKECIVFVHSHLRKGWYFSNVDSSKRNLSFQSWDFLHPVLRFFSVSPGLFSESSAFVSPIFSLAEASTYGCTQTAPLLAIGFFLRESHFWLLGHNCRKMKIAESVSDQLSRNNCSAGVRSRRSTRKHKTFSWVEQGWQNHSLITTADIACCGRLAWAGCQPPNHLCLTPSTAEQGEKVR